MLFLAQNWPKFLAPCTLSHRPVLIFDIARKRLVQSKNVIKLTPHKNPRLTKNIFATLFLDFRKNSFFEEMHPKRPLTLLES